jgi:uncharacterized protein (UPF0218 family)
MPRVGTRSASSDGAGAWIVPASLRDRLAARYGPVLAGPAAEERIRGLGLFASCGDRVTATAIATGHLPKLGIVDYATLRNEPIAPGSFDALARVGRRRVRNPAGMLTEALRRAVREMLDGAGGLLEVEGEEDLGALALVESLPVGATVIYGIPGAGVSFVTVDAAAQERVRALIGAMEFRRLDLGP